jgi:hypothetical protein
MQMALKSALSEFFETNLNDRVFKSLGIFVFLLISLALLIIVRIPPADGYELSIYAAYPQVFWVCVVTSMVLSVVIIVSGIFDSKYWKFGILSFFLNYCILFYLPFFRGYQFLARGTSDLFVHLGFVRYIATSGHIPIFIIGPFIHVFGAILNLFSLSLSQCVYFSDLVFSLLYLISFLLIGQSALKCKSGALFCFVFATPLLYYFLQVSFLPFFFAISVLPLVFYCLHKIFDGPDRWEFHLLMIIIAFCIVFLHPLVMIMLILFFSIYVIIHFSGSFSKQFGKNSNRMVNFLVILYSSFFVWYFSFISILHTIGKIIDSLLSSLKPETIAESQVNLVRSSDASILFIAERFVKIYGSVSLYLLLACFVAIYTFFRKTNKAKTVDYLYSYQLVGGLIFGIVLSVIYSVIFEPIRAISFLIVISTILCGVGFYRFFENTSSKTIKVIVICTMIFIVGFSNIMGVFNLYDSPWKGLPNKQMTHMESTGLDWYLYNANYLVPLMIQYNSLNIYSGYNYPSNVHDSNQINESWNIPSHFGYNNNSYLFDTFGSEKKYMITHELMRQAYLSIPKTRWNFADLYLDEDFEKLNNDPTVDKIYLNGEFEVWEIRLSTKI